MKKGLTILLIGLFIITITACGNKQTKSVFNFNTKTAVEEKTDGWLYYFNYDYINNDDGTIKDINYYFGGYNLKYKHINGYDIPIINEETGKVTDTAKSSLPYLSIGKDIKSDLDKISDYFLEKQFVNKIKMSDLDGLDLNKIDKQDVLKLFNEAIQKDKMPDGKYYYLPEADIKKEKNVLSGYQWQVGFFIAHGNIYNIRIELIYDENTYLSDLINDDKTDKNQKNIYDKIKEIEKNIIDKQSFIADDIEELEIGNIKFKRLYKILEEIDCGGQNID